MSTAPPAVDTDHQDDRPSARRRPLLPDPAIIWATFQKRFWLFAGVAALVLAVVVGLLMTVDPRYSATATLLLEPREQEQIRVRESGYVPPADDQLIDTAVQLISSPAVALAVVRELELDENPDFVGDSSEDPGQTPAAPPAEKAPAAATAGPQADQGETGPEPLEAINPPTAAEGDAMRTLLENTGISRVGMTYVIAVTVNAKDPEIAAAAANEIARQYIALQVGQQQGDAQRSGSFIQRRAEELRAQAVADDAALQNYMVRNNLMSAEGATMAEQEVSQLNTQIAEAQANLARERGRLRAAQGQIRSGGGGADVGAALASDTVRQLRQQESQVSARLAQLQARYGSLHPEVVDARDELADVRRQLNGELARIRSSIEADVRIAESGLNSLLASRAQANSQLQANSTAQVGLLELERRAEASRAVYNAFLTRAKEVAQTTELPDADARISTVARVPDSPAWPNYQLVLLGGVLAALAAGGGAIGVAEYLDSSIGSRSDVEDELDVRYAGAIPLLETTIRGRRNIDPPESYLLSHPYSAFAEAMRNLGAFLLLKDKGKAQIIAITSPLPREGKSTVSMCLARTLARSKRRVVLVDADVRRHTVSDRLAVGVEDERLFRAMTGELPLDEALVQDEHTSLLILPTRGPTDGDDSIDPDQLAQLFAELRERFDVIIVDTAPALGLADARTVGAAADRTLLITRWRKTPIKAARAALDLLTHSGASVAGVALSMVDVRRYASAGLTDASAYHKKFAGYYVN